MEEQVEEKKIKVFKEIVEWCFCIFLALIIALATRYYIFTSTVVKQFSMYPTLKEKQLLIGSSLYKVTDNITYGDIVTVKYDKECIIKRVVGLPGDTIKIENNILYRNDEEVKEDYANFIYPSVKIDVEKTILGEEEYFVLGDNRSVSKDSRIIGPIHKDDIISKIIGDY